MKTKCYFLKECFNICGFFGNSDSTQHTQSQGAESKGPGSKALLRVVRTPRAGGSSTRVTPGSGSLCPAPTEQHQGRKHRSSWELGNPKRVGMSHRWKTIWIWGGGGPPSALDSPSGSRAPRHGEGAPAERGRGGRRETARPGAKVYTLGITAK